jgi:cytochrome c
LGRLCLVFSAKKWSVAKNHQQTKVKIFQNSGFWSNIFIYYFKQPNKGVSAMKKTVCIAMMAAAGMLLAGQASADEALAKAKGCMACHKVDAKLIGPAYKDVAAKYKASDVATLAKKVQTGGSGVWGAVPMAPNKVTDDEAKKLVTWILTLKK